MHVLAEILMWLFVWLPLYALIIGGAIGAVFWTFTAIVFIAWCIWEPKKAIRDIKEYLWPPDEADEEVRPLEGR